MIDIRTGDCRAVLKTLPVESIDCVVTSPPYWGLRDYHGVAGQLGLEPTLGEHIETMVAVFCEVRRVLKKTGTLWLNYGDCYATSPNGRSAADTKAAGNDDRTFRDKPFSTIGPIQARSNGGEGQHHDRRGGVLKPKDLCMVSNRLAIALQDDGWWVRSEIIWAKPNPMPESIADRPTTSHEKVWLLSKSAKYFYDAAAIRAPPSQALLKQVADGYNGHDTKEFGASMAQSASGTKARIIDGARRKIDKQRGHSRSHAGFNDRWDLLTRDEQMALGSNCRNVWTIATAPFPDAHFATFPTELAERCIKAGCPADGMVLDPFGGSGTVGLVADRLQRNAILIELNPEYVEMAHNRIEQDRGGLLDIMECSGT